MTHHLIAAQQLTTLLQNTLDYVQFGIIADKACELCIFGQ